MRSSVGVNGGCEVFGLNKFGGLKSSFEDILHGGVAIGTVGNEFLREFGQTQGEPGAVAHWKPILSRLPSFDSLADAVGIPIDIKDAQSGGLIELVGCVASPVPNRQI